MPYQVEIEPLGAIVEVEEGQTILDAALRAGVYLPHACGHGLCSTCKVDILEGDVEQGDASPFALMDFERDDGKCLACCAVPQSDLVIEVDIEEEVDAQIHLVRDFKGIVSKIETMTPRIKGIFIALEQDKLDFQAGQYVNVIIPGLESQPRAFSISSPPSESELIELNVSLIENGQGTSYIHNDLKVGDEISFTGPYGRFFVRKSQPEPIIFLSGGSGLSSPKSMILNLLESGASQSITLIYGARNTQELYYRGLFERLQQDYENFRYVPVVSAEPEGSDWSGIRGYVHDAADEVFDGRFEGYKAYLCGSPPMIDACISTLMKGRLFERDIYLENFYTNASKSEKPKSPLFKSI
jgi:phenol hydroxylase P5 protein